MTSTLRADTDDSIYAHGKAAAALAAATDTETQQLLLLPERT